MNKVIFFVACGTGGHLFPAIAIGNCLEKNGYKLLRKIFSSSF